MPRTGIFLTILLLLSIISRGWTQTLSATFRVFQTIGKEETSTLLLAGPEKLITDEQGRLYVVDRRDPRIHVFTASGRFLRSLGHRGQGPGAFQRIDALYWHSGYLHVVDTRNARLTVLDTLGQVHRIISRPELGHSLIKQVVPFSPDSLLLVGRWGTENSNCLLFWMNAQFQPYPGCLASADTFWPEDDLKPVFTRMVFIRAAISDHTVIAVSEAYDGKWYHWQHSGSRWKLKISVAAPPASRVYTLLPRNTTPWTLPDSAWPGVFFYSGTAGRLGFRLHAQSLGLFAMRDGSWLHLIRTVTSRYHKTYWVEMMETTSPRRKRMRVASLPGTLLYKDVRDIFYFSSLSGEQPVIYLAHWTVIR